MSRATTIREAILECFRAHGGRTLTNREVNQWVKRGYPNRWKDVSTDLADLTIGGNTSSGYRDLEKCLIRVAPGEYCLDQAFLPQELPDGDRVAMSPTMTRVGGTTSSGENEAQSTGPDAGTAFSVVGTPATFATSAP